jgi:hypothetical protein
MATAFRIQLEARKVADPVLLTSPNPEDRLLIDGIVARLNFSPDADLIFFWAATALGPGCGGGPQNGSRTSVLMPAEIRYACLSWSDAWFIVLLPASDHNQFRETSVGSIESKGE